MEDARRMAVFRLAPELLKTRRFAPHAPGISLGGMRDESYSIFFHHARQRRQPRSQAEALEAGANLLQASSMFAAGATAVNVVGFFTALLSFRGFGAPRAYQLKASNACLSFQHSAGQRRDSKTSEYAVKERRSCICVPAAPAAAEPFIAEALFADTNWGRWPTPEGTLTIIFGCVILI